MTTPGPLGIASRRQTLALEPSPHAPDRPDGSGHQLASPSPSPGLEFDSRPTAWKRFQDRPAIPQLGWGRPLDRQVVASLGRWPCCPGDHPTPGKRKPPASTSLPGERGASFWFGHHLPPCCGRAQPSSLLRVAAHDTRKALPLSLTSRPHEGNTDSICPTSPKETSGLVSPTLPRNRTRISRPAFSRMMTLAASSLRPSRFPQPWSR
jgi:hypothetical protein